MRGKLIVLEGLDGSGKATQTKHLYDALCARGNRVRMVSFPNYKSDSSALVRMYLAGEFGRDPEDVDAFAASAFYAVDRYASFKRDWGSFYEDGGIVLADRYTTSNAIHQCSKLPEEQRDAFLEWLFSFEYSKLKIPEPDLVIYLQTDVQNSQRMMDKRYDGNTEKKDIHERNLDYLIRSKATADYCADKLGWHTVVCSKNGVMRSEQEIHNDIVHIVDHKLKILSNH